MINRRSFFGRVMALIPVYRAIPILKVSSYRNSAEFRTMEALSKYDMQIWNDHYGNVYRQHLYAAKHNLIALAANQIPA